jgi:hypothetical protein
MADAAAFDSDGPSVTTMVARVGTVMRAVAEQAREGAATPGAAVATAARRAPAILAASRTSAEDALVMLRSSSTESLWLGAVFAAGASSGLLLSRAPRAVAALASVPALVLGGMVLGRRGAPGGRVD